MYDISLLSSNPIIKITIKKMHNNAHDAHLQNLRYLYPKYSHSRRKTQWMEPNTEYDHSYYDYDGNYGYGREGVLAERDQLYLRDRLREEKLYNTRSMLIIQDLLEERRKMEGLGRREADVAAQLAKVNESIRDKILNKRTSGTSSFRQQKFKNPSFSPQTNKQKPSQKNYDTITKTTPNTKRFHQPHSLIPNPNTSTKTKQQILRKLFDSQSPQKQKQKISNLIKLPPQAQAQAHHQLHSQQRQYTQPSLVVREEDRGKKRGFVGGRLGQDNDHKDNNQKGKEKEKSKEGETEAELDILREEVKFLKEELNEKNKCVVQYKCQIVRLQKIEQILSDLLKKQQSNPKTIESPSTPAPPPTPTITLTLARKQINLLINPKKPKKPLTIANSIPYLNLNPNLPTTNQQQKTEAETQTEIQLIQTPHKSQINISLSTKNIEAGSKIGGDSQIDFYLTPTQYPIGSGEIVVSQGKKKQEQQQESRTIDGECQTDSAQIKEESAQTTERYEQIIEDSYLQWLFQKDYQQMQKKNQQKTSQTTPK